MEKNREPRNKPPHTRSTNFDNAAKNTQDSLFNKWF